MKSKLFILSLLIFLLTACTQKSCPTYAKDSKPEKHNSQYRM